jgi:hypothetical protein
MHVEKLTLTGDNARVRVRTVRARSLRAERVLCLDAIAKRVGVSEPSDRRSRRESCEGMNIAYPFRQVVLFKLLAFS